MKHPTILEISVPLEGSSPNNYTLEFLPKALTPEIEGEYVKLNANSYMFKYKVTVPANKATSKDLDLGNVMVRRITCSMFRIKVTLPRFILVLRNILVDANYLMSLTEDLKSKCHDVNVQVDDIEVDDDSKKNVWMQKGMDMMTSHILKSWDEDYADKVKETELVKNSVLGVWLKLSFASSFDVFTCVCQNSIRQSQTFL